MYGDQRDYVHGGFGFGERNVEGSMDFYFDIYNDLIIVGNSLKNKMNI